jgi:hypothetical protein
VRVANPAIDELAGLNASAVAVALTVLAEFPQIREKKVGKAVCWICTVTTGFTVNLEEAPEREVQSVASAPAGAEYFTVTLVAARLPTAFCDATACAA